MPDPKPTDDVIEKLLTGRCGSCHDSLSGDLGIMPIDRIPTWEYPIVINGEERRAMAICCFACGQEGRPPKEVVELTEGEIVYHPVDELQAID